MDTTGSRGWKTRWKRWLSPRTLNANLAIPSPFVKRRLNHGTLPVIAIVDILVGLEYIRVRLFVFPILFAQP